MKATFKKTKFRVKNKCNCEKHFTMKAKKKKRPKRKKDLLTKSQIGYQRRIKIIYLATVREAPTKQNNKFNSNSHFHFTNFTKKVLF